MNTCPHIKTKEASVKLVYDANDPSTVTKHILKESMCNWQHQLNVNHQYLTIVGFSMR